MVGLSNKDIKIGENKFSISPSLLRSYISGDEVLMVYENNIFCPDLMQGSKLKINLKELENKLNEFIKEKEYIKLKTFDTKKSLYVFNIEKWLKDSLKSNHIQNGFNGFQKNLKLNKLPRIVLETNNHTVITQFINSYFKKFINKNADIKKQLIGDIANNFNKKFGTNFYDYSYDYDSNKIIFNIKPIYYNAILSSTAINIKNKTNVKKVDFDKSVYTLLKYRK